MTAHWAAPMASDVGGLPPPTSDEDKELHNWSSLIGIIVAIVGNALIALALNVQRFAHVRIHRDRVRSRGRLRALGSHSPTGSYGTMSPGSTSPRLGGGRQFYSDDSDADNNHDDVRKHKESKHHASDKVTYLQSPYWWAGQVIMTVGEIGNFLAYGFAPASVVSPLGVVALVANCIIAPIFFGERFRGQDLLGVLVAILGVATVVSSAKGEETRLDPDDVWNAITQTPFEIYMAVSVVAIVVLVVMSRRHGRKTILIDLGLVGLFGGYTALATKAISSMLSASFFGAFAFPLSYLLLLVLLVTAVLQIRYVNRSLQRFDSTQVIPVQFVMFTMSVIIGSAILYRDFERTTLDQFFKFVGGCLMTFFGVFLVTNGRPDAHNDDDEHYADEEGERYRDDDGDDNNEDGTLSDAEGVAETIGLSRQEALSPSIMPEQSSRTPVGASPGLTKSPRRVVSESTPVLPSEYHHPDLLGIGQHADLVPTESSTHTRNHSVSHFQGPPATPRRQSLQRQHTFSPSPLSTTVTTVVHDALGQPDTPTGLVSGSPLRRIRSTIRASLFLADESNGGDAEAGLAAPVLLRANSHHHTRTHSRSHSRSHSRGQQSISQPHSLSRQITLSPVHDMLSFDDDDIHPDDPLALTPVLPQKSATLGPPISASSPASFNERARLRGFGAAVSGILRGTAQKGGGVPGGRYADGESSASEASFGGADSDDDSG